MRPLSVSLRTGSSTCCASCRLRPEPSERSSAATIRRPRPRRSPSCSGKRQRSFRISVGTTQLEENIMAKGVWIVAEQRDGILRKISFELAGAARKLADQLGEEVGAILLGSGVNNIAGELAKYGADKIYVADNQTFEPYTTDAHAEAVAKAVREHEP